MPQRQLQFLYIRPFPNSKYDSVCRIQVFLQEVLVKILKYSDEEHIDILFLTETWFTEKKHA